MKTPSLRLHCLACVCAIITGVFNCAARSFEAGGLNFNVLSEEDKTCSLTGATTLVSGELVIPATVRDESGVEFKVTTIAENAFGNNHDYTGDLVIPEGVTTIERWAFGYCSGFDGKLKLPSTLTEIGNTAFAGCAGFTGELILPAKLTKIGYSAFADCTGFTDSLTIPGGVAEIEPNAFSGCTGLSSKLLILNGVETIGEEAFSGCTGMTDTLALPATLKRIESRAFYKCGFTDSLALPGTLTFIGSYAFYECSGFTESLIIPDAVETIGYESFYGCTGFTNDLKLPAKLTTFETGAFNGCTGLSGELIIPEGVKTIGRDAFWGCTNLSGELKLPGSLTAIDDKAFYACRGLKGDLVIPAGVTTIGSSAFQSCDGFDGELTLPSSLESIGKNAFDGCTGLKGTLKIPDGVTFIGSGAFNRCRSLTGDLTLPSNLTSVADNLFYGCLGMNGTLTIPENITGIGAEAFNHCNNFKSIVMMHPLPPALGAQGFSEVAYANIPLHVPAENIEDYKEAEEWKNFANIEGFDIIPVTAIELDSVEATIARGEIFQLVAALTPDDATFKAIQWKSEDESIATVTPGGFVTGVSEGETTITATASSGVTATCALTVTKTVITASDIAVYPRRATIEVGDRLRLKAVIQPENTADKSVEWSVEDGSIATVSQEGLVTGVAVGETIVYATTANNKAAACTITVNPRIFQVTKLSVNPSAVTLEVEEKYELSVIYSPDYATDKTVVWISDDETIATVDEKGLITAVSPGETEITVTATNGVSATCKVTVKEKTVYADEVTLDKQTAAIEEDQTLQLTATLAPDTTTDKTVTWTSSETNVATVDENGLVKAILAGKTTITATAAGGAKATCALTVTAKFIEIETFAVSPEATTVELGKNLRLSAIITPYNATNKATAWSSDNEAVATVDGSGLVRGASLGTANITATAKNGMTSTCVITVIPATVGIAGVDGDESSEVKTEGSNIVAPAGSKVYDINGRRVAASNLAAGIYVVITPDGKAHKVKI